VLDPLSDTAPPTRHAVTAIIVAHDGARLLPGLVRALKAQTHPVEQMVGVDTASRDRSGAILAELIGQDAVFGMHRSTGYGDAVAIALRHAARRRSGVTDPNPARVEWVWLLHDDCEPAPDALERLLRAAGKDRSVVILGPKVVDGRDRRTLREVGVSIDRAGRRVTGIDPGEIDQGQHDHKGAVLAVGSAGMLVRRDVWDRLGGFDPHLRLFRDDVDFCWRAQAAGFRVQVVPGAVLYHRELSARRRRPTEGGSARLLDRRNALWVLAVNLPLLTMLWVVAGCIAGSLARAVYFLLTKQLDQAAAYAYSVVSLFGHPVRLLQGRRRRARGSAEGYNAVRMFIPPARTLFRLAERIAALISKGPPQASGGRHQASGEESEEDEQFVDTQSVLRRVIGHPGVQLFTALLVVSLIAERRLLRIGPLGGGALVPAWGGAAALWQEYLAGFHAVSIGSTASAPPYLAVVAGLATLFGGQAWLAVDVLLLGCVPLAGLTAYLASRSLVRAAPARVLLAASYALLPVATGAVAAGRLGTAVAFILLPLTAVSAARMLTAAPRQARRAAWATGLLIALTAAFAPLAWVLGTLFAVGTLAARRWLAAANPVNAAIVVVTPFFVLFPWSLYLLTNPSAFLSEAGLSTAALVTRGLAPTALLALSPGGPGVPPVWVTLGFALALVSAVRPGGRTPLVIAGWTVAIAGLLTATVVSRISVTPPAGGQPANGWPGVALAIAALGLLLAAAPTAQLLVELIRNGSGRLPAAAAAPDPVHSPARRLLAGIALVAAATAPLFVAVYWVKGGVRGPVSTVAAPLLPAFVAASSTSGEQYRTLILRPNASGGLDYSVVRQSDPTLGEPELTTAAAAASALSREVAALGAPDGADAGDPGLVLGDFGIKYVLLPGPVDPVLAQRLDAAIGLVALSTSPSYDLWQVAGPVARVRVVATDGTTTVLSAGVVNMAAAAAPARGGTLLLAEPYGGWTATLNGHALKPLAQPVDGWAQGFVLPPGGGQVAVTRNNLARWLSLIAELIAVLAVCVLALPGKRANPVEEAEALTALREARNGKRAAGSPPPAPPAPPARPVRPAAAGHRAGGAAYGARLSRRRPAEDPAGTAADLEPAELGPAELSPAEDVREPESAELAMTASMTAATAATTTGHADWEQAVSAPVADDWADVRSFGRPEPGLPDVTLAWPAPGAEPPPAAATAGGRAIPERPDGEAIAGHAFAETSDAEHHPVEPHLAEPHPVEPHPVEPHPAEAHPVEPNPAEAWDMAGDWTTIGPSGAAGAWADPLADGSQRDATDWRTGPWPASPATGPQAVSRLTGNQPSMEEVPLPDTEPPATEDAAAPGTGPQRLPWESGPQPAVPGSGGQPSFPWETGPQQLVAPAAGQPESSTSGQSRAPWESGPQSAASGTGGQSRAPWESGPQSAASGTGGQSRAPWESGSQPVVSETGAQPRYPWESTSAPAVPGSGGQPRFAWESEPSAPVSSTGGYPVPPASGPRAERAPWEPADRTESQDRAAAPAAAPAVGPGGTAAPAEPSDPGAGTTLPASQPRTEHHSHRAKHGKPSRWRGNRSGRDEGT
jgi:GT2 family glycosyltransferase